MKFFTLIRKTPNADFIGAAKFFVPFSVVLCGVVLYFIATKGFNYGIDFTGGTVVQLKFHKDTPAEDVRKALDAVGEEGASVVSLGEGNTEYLITVRAA